MSTTPMFYFHRLFTSQESTEQKVKKFASGEWPSDYARDWGVKDATPKSTGTIARERSNKPQALEQIGAE